MTEVMVWFERLAVVFLPSEKHALSYAITERFRGGRDA